MSHRVTLIPRAVKDLHALEGKLLGQAESAIRSLSDDPVPPGSLKLSGERNGYRIRVRDIRILYRIDVRSKEVIIFRVRHRHEVYR